MASLSRSKLGIYQPGRRALARTEQAPPIEDALATSPTEEADHGEALDAGLRRVRLMGAAFADVSEPDAAAMIVDAAMADRGHWTITANLDHLRRYTREPRVRQLIDEADMVVADGTPLIWASRLAGVALPERVAGSDMIWSICEAASRRGGSVYLLGGDPGAATRAADVLVKAYPDLEIAGTSCPSMGFEKDQSELDRIECELREAAPRIVLVALGFPKQDLLIERLRGVLPRASFIGVGISLSFVAGDLSRAPIWAQRFGLEWLHRMLKDPRRLVRRYLLQGMPFALRLFASGLRHRLWSRGSELRWGWDTDEQARDESQVRITDVEHHPASAEAISNEGLWQTATSTSRSEASY